MNFLTEVSAFARSAIPVRSLRITTRTSDFGHRPLPQLSKGVNTLLS